MSAPRAVAEKPADRHSPYQGLVPYSEEDADWFFGRTTWSEIIVDHLRAYRVSVLYGASGVGKSSVLGAGVVRTLHAETHDDGRLALLPVAFSSWSLDDPVAALKRAVRDAVAELTPEHAEHPPKGSLADVLDGWAARIDGPLLLILDQFEELFLYAETDDTVRRSRHEAAAEELQRALSRRNPAVHFVLSIREDAFASLDRFERRVPGLLDRLLRLEHLDRDAAEEAIRKPLDRWNSLVKSADRVEIEQGLVTEILDQVQQSSGDGDGAGAAIRTGEIEAPYLQLVLTRLWDAERGLWEQQNGRPRQLRIETLNVRLGRVAKIVDTHLDTALRDLHSEQQAAAAAVFRQLVTPSHTKIALGVADLHAQTQMPEEAIEDVVRRLAAPDVRILRPAGEGRYEIFHDALSRPILAWLRRWTDRQRRRRERRRLALAVGASAALAALAGVFVLLMLRASAAENRAARGEAQALASSALAELQVDPAQAVRSALDSVDVRSTELTDAAIRAVLAQSLLDRVHSIPSRVFAGQYSPDDKLLAVGADDIRVWDTASGRRVARFDGGSSVMGPRL